MWHRLKDSEAWAALLVAIEKERNVARDGAMWPIMAVPASYPCLVSYQHVPDNPRVPLTFVYVADALQVLGIDADLEEGEAKTTEALRDLAERLMHVPVMYGVDQGDVENLRDLARKLEGK